MDGSVENVAGVRVSGCGCGSEPCGDTHSFVSYPGMSPFKQAVWDLIDEAGSLLISKHEDYGPTNISRSPGGPLNGLRVRMWDKIARINNLIDTGADPRHEGLRDSFLDLANYSLIACLVLDEDWPDE